MTPHPPLFPRPTRRDALRLLAGAGLLPLSGCATLTGVTLTGPTLTGPTLTGAAPLGAARAALLLPLSGAAAALGQNMGRAAGLATQAGPPDQAPRLYDTKDTVEGAAAAAGQALADGAKVLFGPLRADQTPGVLAVAGKIPVVTFSNDDRLTAQGAFVMGITPAQSVSAMFSYAKAQGLTRIALLASDSPLGAASATAAVQIAQSGRLQLAATLLRDPTKDGLISALRTASGGTLPQAVFIADGGKPLARFAAGLRGSDLQILGSVQWGVSDVAANRDLNRAWFAAPPPDLFQPFADQFQAAFGTEPGAVAGLAYDAALVATGLAKARALSRKGLVRPAGFIGVLGPFRFDEDGRCHRSLSILGVEAGRIVALGEVAGT